MAASTEVNEVIKVGGIQNTLVLWQAVFLAASPLAYGGSAAKTLFRAFALAIPPATQAKKATDFIFFLIFFSISNNSFASLPESWGIVFAKIRTLYFATRTAPRDPGDEMKCARTFNLTRDEEMFLWRFGEEEWGNKGREKEAFFFSIEKKRVFCSQKGTLKRWRKLHL